MTQPALRELSPTGRRRLVTRGLLRALASTVGLVALYFVLPLDRLSTLPVGLPLGLALLLLLAVSAWQVIEITHSRYPGIRALEAFAVVAPLFLLLFAASYVILAEGDPTSFSQGVLTRTDGLYFTVTTFATVGFGDIAPVSQVARRLVTGQMVLDLLVIGLGIKVVAGAIQVGRQKHATGPELIG